MRTASDQTGMTLVETLVAVSLFVTVISMAIGVLFVGEASSRYMLAWEDQPQILRQAMKQIADDAAFAQWVEAAEGEFSLYGYAPLVNKTDDIAFWGALSDWPGDFYGKYLLIIKYDLVGDCLWRSLSSDMGNAGRQLVTCGLIPASDPGGTVLRATADQVIEVQLSARQTHSGVTRIAQIYTKFFIGQDPLTEGL